MRSRSILNARYALSTRLLLSASALTLLAAVDVPVRKPVSPPRNSPPIPRKKYAAKSPNGDGASLDVTSGTSTMNDLVGMVIIRQSMKNQSRHTCLSTLEYDLLGLVGSPELVEPVPPERAGSISQEAAETEPDDGAERCMPANCFGRPFENFTVVRGQVMLEVRFRKLSQLIVLVMSAKCRERHCEATCKAFVCVVQVLVAVCVKTHPAVFDRRLVCQYIDPCSLERFRASSNSFCDVVMTSCHWKNV